MRVRALRWALVWAAVAAPVPPASAWPQTPPPRLPPALPEAPHTTRTPGGPKPHYALPRSEMRPSTAPAGSTPAAPASDLANTPAPPAPAGYKITLGPRHACVVPRTEKLGGAEGGTVDVQLTDPGTLTALLSGAAAASAYLGCHSAANETFELTQEFEVSCDDPSARTVALTLDSTLLGYLRSKHKSGARVKLATASVVPLGCASPPLALSHPAQAVSGGNGQLCNLHLPPLRVDAMPLGRYVLKARFEIEATAAGLLDAHAAADFSPDAPLPDPFVRPRDPFQGVSKKGFGLTVVLSASAPRL
jgi:hypothetical protein